MGKRSIDRSKEIVKNKDSKERTRKFKKPMDSQAQRKQRIDMVKGMNSIDQGIVDQKKGEKGNKSVI